MVQKAVLKREALEQQTTDVAASLVQNRRLACSKSVRALQHTANHTTSRRWGSCLFTSSILSLEVASVGH